MKQYIYTFLVFALIGCDEESTSIGVTVQSNSNNPSFLSITDLPDNWCQFGNENTSCTITKETKLRWGYGICAQSTSALNDAINQSDIRLVINGVQINNTIVSSEDETFNRVDFPFCHTWLVELENWQGNNYTLQSFDGNQVLETVELTVTNDQTA